MRCDSVDLLLIHWPDVRLPIAEAIGGLDDLRRAGLARYIGVSNFSAAQLREACRVAPIVCNQVDYNLFDRRWELEGFAVAAELGVAMVTYGPLAQGLLSGSLDLSRVDPDDWRRRGDTLSSQRLFAPDNVSHNLTLAHQMAAESRRHWSDHSSSGHCMGVGRSPRGQRPHRFAQGLAARRERGGA